MILRRVVDHLKLQHWTAIGIELLIVILGVFIGTQVSNWNQERAANQQGAVFTEHLKEDLREEDWGYQVMVQYNREVLANAERTVDALDGTVPMPDEAMLISAYRATQYKQKLRRRATYDELISTGAIGLIRDRTLRDTAMRVYNVPTIDNMVREGMQSRYREAFRMSLPTAAQRTIARNCGDRFVKVGDYEGIANTLDYPCQTGLAEDAIRSAASALRSNASLVPLLRLRIADIETRLSDMTVNNRVIMDGLRQVAQEKP